MPPGARERSRSPPAPAPGAAADWQQGVVRWYNGRRQIGSLRGDSGRDVFIPVGAARNQNLVPLTPGGLMHGTRVNYRSILLKDPDERLRASQEACTEVVPLEGEPQPGLECGVETRIGGRASNEDRLVANDLYDLGFLAGVFDGHGGSGCVDYVSQRFPTALHGAYVARAQQLVGGVASLTPDQEADLIKSSFHDAFAATDEEYLDAAKRQHVRDGSTALVVLLAHGFEAPPTECTVPGCRGGVAKLFIANVGDCRAILVRRRKALRLTNDHKPEREDETARIIKAGGVVTQDANGISAPPPGDMLRLPESALGRRAAPEAVAQHAVELSWCSSSGSSPSDWGQGAQDAPAGTRGCGELRRRFPDHWELTGDAPLGQGSVGDVELARPVGGGAPCAVKVISKIHCARDAAIHEAEIMRPLRHPAVCRLVDTCEDSRNVYLVLEHIDGHELFEEIESISGSANEVRAAQIMRQVLEGLAYCHDEVGVVHRDVKPENIMVSDAGGGAPSAKLIDFGIALRAGDLCDELEGTEPYLAPEARYGARAHRAVDLWSAGVVLHVLLTGRLLPEAIQLGHEHLDLERGALSGRRMSTPAKDLISGLLQPDPRGRLTAAAAAAHPWLRRADQGPASPAAAAPACPGRWKALAVCFGQLAGSSQLRALRQKCQGLAADSQGRVGKDELAGLVRATALAGAATLPFCVAEALSTLDLEGCGRVASDDWLAWLVAAAEGVDAAYSLAGSIMDKAFQAAGAARRGAAPRQVTQLPTPCRSRAGVPARRPVSVDLALAC